MNYKRLAVPPPPQGESLDEYLRVIFGMLPVCTSCGAVIGDRTLHENACGQPTRLLGR